MAASIPAARVQTVIFACEAGMGSSIMGVSALKKKLRLAGVEVAVEHRAVRSLPEDAAVILTHRALADLARQKSPAAVVIAFTRFLDDPVFDQFVQSLRSGGDIREVR